MVDITFPSAFSILLPDPPYTSSVGFPFYFYMGAMVTNGIDPAELMSIAFAVLDTPYGTPPDLNDIELQAGGTVNPSFCNFTTTTEIVGNVWNFLVECDTPDIAIVDNPAIVDISNIMRFNVKQVDAPPWNLNTFVSNLSSDFGVNENAVDNEYLNGGGSSDYSGFFNPRVLIRTPLPVDTSVTGGLSVKDAIPLPCYTPCRPYLLQKDN